jgi:hypothetical protein
MQVRSEIFKAHRRELLAFGRSRHWPPPFVTGLALRGFSSAKKLRGFILALLGRFLWGKRGNDCFKARVGPQRVPKRIEPQMTIA